MKYKSENNSVITLAIEKSDSLFCKKNIIRTKSEHISISSLTTDSMIKSISKGKTFPLNKISTEKQGVVSLSPPIGTQIHEISGFNDTFIIPSLYFIATNTDKDNISLTKNKQLFSNKPSNIKFLRVKLDEDETMFVSSYYGVSKYELDDNEKITVHEDFIVSYTKDSINNVINEKSFKSSFINAKPGRFVEFIGPCNLYIQNKSIFAENEILNQL